MLEQKVSRVEKLNKRDKTDVIAVGDFNEDANAKNIQYFTVDIGLHEVFSEVYEADEINRDGTFKH